MICQNCGNAIDDNAAICVHCGVATPRGIAMGVGGVQQAPVDPNEPASSGLVFLSFFIPLAGIILGATESSKGRTRASKSYFIGAIVGMVFWVVISMIILLLTILAPFLMMIPIFLSNSN